MQADLIIKNIGELVTCASTDGPKRGAAMRDVCVVENGAVAVDRDSIVAVGSGEEIGARYESANQIDAGGRVVCPGFVDPHTHIVFAGDRLEEFELKIKGADYLEILANGGGIISTVRKTRAASDEQLVAEGLVRLDRMLECGTTTCEIKTGYGLDLETELKMLRVIEKLDQTHVITIVPTFLAAHAVPPEFKDDSGAYVDLVCEAMLPAAWAWYLESHFNGNVPFFADVFCEKNAFDLDQSRRILETAKSLGFGLKAHVDEFTNLGGSAQGVEIGAASIDHLDAISEGEVERLASSSTIGIVTPTVNFNFGSSEFANARRFVDAGCSVALSTDYNPGSAPSPSQPMTMAIACRYQRLLPSEAFNAVTINAAHAIGLGDRFGSIEVGKRADLLVLDAEDYREVIYEFGSIRIAKVIKGGHVVHERESV